LNVQKLLDFFFKITDMAPCAFRNDYGMLRGQATPRSWFTYSCQSWRRVLQDVMLIIARI